jgi:hypothetical protein
VRLHQNLPADGTNRFHTTRWSVVLLSAKSQASDCKEAFAALCSVYWYPLYGFIRHRGYSPEDAQDLTQGFFLHLIERKTLRRVDRAKGKFRSFLLASLQNYLSTDVYGDEEKYFGKVPGKRGFSVRFEPVVYRADDTVSIVRTTMRPVQSSTRPGSVTSCRKMAASIFGPSPSACSAICRPQFTGATFLLTRAGATQIRGPICYPMPSGKRHARSSAAGEILPQSF